MKTILKACPFCGGTEDLKVSYDIEDGKPAVRCNWCDAQGPIADSREKAIELWNKREMPHREDDDAIS